MVEMWNWSAHTAGRVRVYSTGARDLEYHSVQLARCRSRVRSNGSKSAVSASVAADSVLLPKASATTDERGSSPSSATLPGPAEEYSQAIAPLRAKSCQPSLVPT